MSGKIFVWLLATVFLTTASPVRGQQAKKLQRIGFLTPTSLGSYGAFRQGLRELGYVEGNNLIIEYPKAEGNLTRAAARAAELVRLKVDVIVTTGATDTRAAKEATTTIPIVFLQDPDPVGNGFVTSLARPGGISPDYPRLVRTYLVSGWSCSKTFYPSSRVWRCLEIQPTRVTEFN
jgi:ABC-type uncharacterized transport system substrate-binding protein